MPAERISVRELIKVLGWRDAISVRFAYQPDPKNPSRTIEYLEPVRRGDELPKEETPCEPTS